MSASSKFNEQTKAKTDVIILGAQKAATTTLFDMLCATGAFIGSTPKEPHYFSEVIDWREELDRYHAIYKSENADRLRLEASTSYTFHPHRADALWNDLYAYNPDLRLIYIVRKPIDRVLSHYRHSLMRGYAKGDIDRFVREYPLSLDITRYHSQIAPYIEVFGKDQVLVLLFDEVTKAPEATIAKIGDFLGLTLGYIPPVHSNKAGEIAHRWEWEYGLLGKVAARFTRDRRRRRVKSAKVSDDLKNYINAELKAEVSALEGLLGSDLSNWKS